MQEPGDRSRVVRAQLPEQRMELASSFDLHALYVALMVLALLLTLTNRSPAISLLRDAAEVAALVSAKNGVRCGEYGVNCSVRSWISPTSLPYFAPVSFLMSDHSWSAMNFAQRSFIVASSGHSSR